MLAMSVMTQLNLRSARNEVSRLRLNLGQKVVAACYPELRNRQKILCRRESSSGEKTVLSWPLMRSALSQVSPGPHPFAENGKRVGHLCGYFCVTCFIAV
jgi:hypothetical protein